MAPAFDVLSGLAPAHRSMRWLGEPVIVCVALGSDTLWPARLRATLMKPEEFAVLIIARHAELMAKNPEFRNFVFHHVRSVGITKLVVDALEEVAPMDRTVDFLRPIQLWWSESVTSSPPRDEAEEFKRLHAVLHYLNAAYSSKEEVTVRVGNEALILGRRWWSTRAKQLGNDGSTHGFFKVTSQLPHIRVIPGAYDGRFIYHERERTFLDARVKQELRIGLCAFDGATLTEFKATKVVNSDGPTLGFVACGMERDSSATPTSYEDELISAIKWARESAIHVLCLPELSVCPRGRAIVLDQLRRDSGVLSLLIVGSFHESDGDSGWMNAAPYWVIDDSRNVEEVSSFRKTQPFTTSVEIAAKLPQMRSTCERAEEERCLAVAEDIVLGAKAHILRTPIGAIGIMICKDYLVAQELLATYLPIVDHLFVPSMNAAGAAWFVPQAEQAARSDDAVATFYVNCTQVVDPASTDVDVLFWRVPGERGQNRLSRFFRAGTASRHARLLPSDGCVPVGFKIPEVLVFPW